MRKKLLNPIWLLGVLLIMATSACGSLNAPTPTAAPTNAPTATSLPTSTAQPTSTPVPTATQDLVATQQALDLQARIQRYIQNNYLNTAQGNFVKIEEATYALAKMNYLDFEDAGYNGTLQDFAAWTHIKLDSAASVNYPEYSACGFAFRINKNGDAYAATLSKDRVIFAACRNGNCKEVGKARGTGRVAYPNNFEADFELIVNGQQAVVLADGQFIGEYLLSGDYLTDPGNFSYVVFSGTNQDYGTRCEFDNSGLWIPQLPNSNAQSG
jgi:hypothetical protein